MNFALSSGWASQWYPSPFQDPDLATEKEEEEESSNNIGPTFLTAEHYMMYRKAILFSDTAIAQKILIITATSHKDMTTIKALGRKVVNFDQAKWDEERVNIVKRGNELKFQNNTEILESLLATGKKKLVEAAPRDRVWGIGYGEKNAMKNQGKWGRNLLGIILTDLRDKLREEREESDE